MSEIEIPAAVWDPERIQAFFAAHEALIRKAALEGIPICVIEGGLRDALTRIDGNRLIPLLKYVMKAATVEHVQDLMLVMAKTGAQQ
jgi:hypothetical protein